MSSRTRNPRRHGRAPFRVVVVHGGPGASGSLAPVARALAVGKRGVLEPWQTALSVPGLVDELTHQIDGAASAPVTLIGHSWGAWLSLLVAAEHPDRVRRLILVSSGPFQSRDAREIYRRRRQRLPPRDWKEFAAIGKRLADPRTRVAPAALRRFARLAERADAYDLLRSWSHPPRTDPKVFRAVWTQADRMRRSGALARALRRVRAPVVVVHGRDDSHPVEGVVGPLRRAGLRVRVILLDRCGHEPWRERHARAAFIEALRSELDRDVESSR